MVFDKFHVIAHVNDAVNAVRRAEIQMGGWEAKNALKGSRWIWLKNPENLTDKQRATQQRIETGQYPKFCVWIGFTRFHFLESAS